MMRSDDSGVSAVARDLYLLWRERREAGAGRNFEEFVRQWPQHELELRRRHAESEERSAAAPTLPPPEGTALQTAAQASALAAINGLRTVRSPGERYRIDGVLGRGGAGIVLRVLDRSLGRELAMKMLRAEFESAANPGDNSHGLRRLIDEAAVLGKLEHPSIVPVHELGVDERGRVYFTMPRIEGLPLAEVIPRVAAGDPQWTRERVLEVLLKVCDALAYAHERGVLHRDLKPANIMVGKFGQVYVVDWGLARAQDPEPGGSNGNGNPAGLTLVGDVLGTPSYMSPEQARGDKREVDAATDIYAIGALLYELLAGRAPYLDLDVASDSSAVLRAALAGPPTDLERLAPDAPGELLAIARKAMAREKSGRYASVAALAGDLRAFMEGRVVSAHEHGGFALLRKWVLRNRALAGALAGLLLVAAAAAVTVLTMERAQTKAAREQADARALASLREREVELWPSHPDKLPAMQRWLDDARDLASRIPEYRGQLEALRARAGTRRPEGLPASAPMLPLMERIATLQTEIDGLDEDIKDMAANASGLGKDQGIDFSRQEQQRRLRTIERLRATVADHDAWVFTDHAAQARSEELSRVLSDALELDDRIDGGIVLMEARMRSTQAVERESLIDAADSWRAALASIADPKACPKYAGLTIEPQYGLVPLGRDPDSGLWEFADVATGLAPARDDQGKLVLGPEHGIVFVLLPPGEVEMGHDSRLPVEPVFVRATLQAFFMAKHELTQAQWFRMTGENPSYYRVGTEWQVEHEPPPGPRALTTVTWSWPVDQINWYQAQDTLRRFGLRLPTEAQWEYGCRAGTSTHWSLAATLEELQGMVNASHYGWSGGAFDDGWHITCPIGTFPANPWGLYEVHGNVREWTLEPFWTTFRFPLRAGDGMSLAPESRLRNARGGSIGHGPESLWSGAREDSPPSLCDRSTGVRPVRSIATAER